MSNKDRVTKGLVEIGAAWAISSDRYVCARYDCGCKRAEPIIGRRCYHVHPDSSWPNEMDILAFDNLDQIAGYIAARTEAAKVDDNAKAMDIMEGFWASLP